MQISRHWRLNANRYRLEGYVLADGETSLEPRKTTAPAQSTTDERDAHKGEVELATAERTAA
ncbi:MAG: hypothetical protein IT298_02855 [Chloroflexi bacterium]|jgi:hypothetical protein|nr:MAG: hypothetical protein UZ13_00438 [Chloroflexi bacterium OLB13]MBV6435725.1 hypothetical protein [Anaerolineae bacterium]MCC6564678.1 hypothetical protein [Chloroflexota bacterium]MDL1915012.1 hypothetical protein [Anaerolineae bacterium CFX4]MCO6444707.1 hypothetical protein [Anaerolineae bacterium]